MTCQNSSFLQNRLLCQYHHLLFLLLICLSIIAAVPVISAAPIAKPGCKDSCGGTKIPFPFGIGLNCFLNPWYEITCEGEPPIPFLTKLIHNQIQVKHIIYGDDWDEFEESILTVGIPPFNSCTPRAQSNISLRGSPFKFVTQSNVFVMQGCEGTAVLRKHGKEIIAGCSTICDAGDHEKNFTGGCYGVKCCQSSLTTGIDHQHQDLDPSFVELTPEQRHFDYYEVEFHNPTSSNGDCLVSTLVDSRINYNTLLSGRPLASDNSFTVPVVLAWTMQLPRSEDSSKSYPYCHMSNYVYDDTGPNCFCPPGSRGNPYLSDGCQVIEQCKKCKGRDCYGPVGNGDGPDAYWCDRKPFLNLAAILGLSIGAGIPLLVISCYWLYRLFKRRKEKKQRAKFFKRNGGLLLQQQLSSEEGAVDRSKIFTTSELDKATDRFNQNRVLGQGGQGTVYKGMLSDGRIVAIKKSKQVDESQLGQFINEVVILSQINHRNVVKLLGCCLETEVPLLVYEFIQNGTLAQHIYRHQDEEDCDHLAWQMRLRIAAESAGAIAYLHSSSSPPIYHRDIKSSNILLDEKHRAKVSDFGSSKTIAIDQTHLTTLVQGTMGYLDPEYFQSYQFTEKSDVYSFGVVLLELLTSQKPIYRGVSMEQKNLVTEFYYVMENGGSLLEFVDPRVVEEAEEEALLAVVSLASRCLSWSSKLRPTMKEVTMILEMIIQSPSNVHVPMLKSEVTSPVDMGKEYVVAKTVDQEDGQLEKSGGSVQMESGSGKSGDAFSSVDIELPLLFNTK